MLCPAVSCRLAAGGVAVKAARIDANQTAIVSALRKVGCDVQSLAEAGGGGADLLVFVRARKQLLLLEVKDGKKSPSQRALTPDQVKWHERFPVTVVKSVDEALEAVR